MHLDAGAVELQLERRFAERIYRLRHALGRRREHRLYRPEQLNGIFRQRLRTVHERCARHLPQVSAQHRRLPDGCSRRMCRFRDGFRDHTFLRTLTKFAGKETHEKFLFAFGCAAEDIDQELCSRARRPGAPDLRNS